MADFLSSEVTDSLRMGWNWTEVSQKLTNVVTAIIMAG